MWERADSLISSGITMAELLSPERFPTAARSSANGPRCGNTFLLRATKNSYSNILLLSIGLECCCSLRRMAYLANVRRARAIAMCPPSLPKSTKCFSNHSASRISGVCACGQSEFAQRLYSCETTPAYDRACCQLENRCGNSATSFCTISSREAVPSINSNVLRRRCPSSES